MYEVKKINRWWYVFENGEVLASFTTKKKALEAVESYKKWRG